ncbi:hypothetical protein AEGHOMDF_5984 [Methylobacterium soli]|nr:hypothetical protein AEGHOMDF_5984 [Methylobacterium soli]
MDQDAGPDPQGLSPVAETDGRARLAVIDLDQNGASERNDELVTRIRVTSARDTQSIDLHEEDALDGKRHIFPLLESNKFATPVCMHLLFQQSNAFDEINCGCCAFHAGSPSL